MQAEVSAERGVQKRQASSLYLMTWVAIAAFGVGYLGVAATRPDLIGAMLPLADPPPEQTSARQVTDLSEEIISLRKWVHELQHDLTATRSTLQDQVTSNTALVERLAVTEERLNTLHEVKDPAPAQKTPPAKAQTRAQGPAPADSKVAQAPSTDGGAGGFTTNVRVINPPAAPIATGSLPEKRAASAPVAKIPPALPRAIEIGSSESLDGLRDQWNNIAGRNGDVLASASPRYRLSVDGRAQPFTLLAGPFGTPADANKACAALRAKGVACRVSGTFSGNAL